MFTLIAITYSYGEESRLVAPILRRHNLSLEIRVRCSWNRNRSLLLSLIPDQAGYLWSLPLPTLDKAISNGIIRRRSRLLVYFYVSDQINTWHKLLLLHPYKLQRAA